LPDSEPKANSDTTVARKDPRRTQSPKITILYSSRYPSSILLRDELDRLQRSNPDKLTVKYFVDDLRQPSLSHDQNLKSDVPSAQNDRLVEDDAVSETTAFTSPKPSNWDRSWSSFFGGILQLPFGSRTVASHSFGKEEVKDDYHNQHSIREGRIQKIDIEKGIGTRHRPEAGIETETGTSGDEDKSKITILVCGPEG